MEKTPIIINDMLSLIETESKEGQKAYVLLLHEDCTVNAYNLNKRLGFVISHDTIKELYERAFGKETKLL